MKDDGVFDREGIRTVLEVGVGGWAISKTTIAHYFLVQEYNLEVGTEKDGFPF